MTEYDRALRDLRSDAIVEVADSMPGALAVDVVNAIIARLSRGLPVLVEVDVTSGNTVRP